jgi:hypothetical protein
MRGSWRSAIRNDLGLKGSTAFEIQAATKIEIEFYRKKRSCGNKDTVYDRAFQLNFRISI